MSATVAAVPPFSMKATRYDMDSYIGRCRHFYSAVNPVNVFRLPTTITDALAKITSVEQGKRDPRWTDAELWQARSICEACVHPRDRQPVFPLFRMAAFMPVNLFIVPFMLLPGTIASPTRTILIHWFNQSYNCAVNYANRSSDAVPTDVLLQGYAAAVGVSITGSLGATFLMRTMKDTTSPRATVVRAVVPFLAVAFSGSANVAMMRRDEWSGRGVEVVDDEGTPRGKSTAAGQIGVLKCASARFLWNLPVMLLPPLLLMPVARSAFFVADKRRLIAAETAACVVGMAFGVAPALAAFKPTDRVPVSRLEPKFHSLTDKAGKKVEYLSFYKGL